MKPTINALPIVFVAWCAESVAETDTVRFSGERIVVDGKASERAWEDARWRNIDKHILGEHPDPRDFSGRYKLLWDGRHLYLLAEISDDVLVDQHADPLLAILGRRLSGDIYR